ncbi:hypothetical protein R1flu_018912 [Riccia fluitans]|uniref:Uncharacterized protein n=1 Tax=Riccia fluitans TaxID=41844 RepID=A0ABD1ZKL3_9MARC
MEDVRRKVTKQLANRQLRQPHRSLCIRPNVKAKAEQCPTLAGAPASDGRKQNRPHQCKTIGQQGMEAKQEQKQKKSLNTRKRHMEQSKGMIQNTLHKQFEEKTWTARSPSDAGRNVQAYVAGLGMAEAFITRKDQAHKPLGISPTWTSTHEQYSKSKTNHEPIVKKI